MKIIDLHSHSTASDGTLSPAELVAAAQAAGVDVLALTDHDSTAGLAEAMQAAQSHLCLIRGVEISVRWQGRTLHVVGLGIDPDQPDLQAGLASQQALREKRATEIAQRLEKLGVEHALQEARALAGESQLTRTHFARLLVDKDHCKDMKQAFKRYLGAGKPAHVGAEWVAMETAIEWIHCAGGVAVLAHPLLYNMTAAWRGRMLAAFRAAGGEATEVCCGGSNAEQVQLSAREALQHGLLGSAGSDFHQPEQRWIRLGRLAAIPAGVTPVWEHPRLTALLH